VLFFVCGSAEKKHQFFVDHKISGLLDEETSFSLEVGSVKEWNSQPETNNDSAFEAKAISYLKGFNGCEVPPVIICSKEDEAWINVLIKKMNSFDIKPMSIEELIRKAIGINVDTILPQIQVETPNMFFDLDKIYTLWKILN
jgi:hypothetical protein